MKILVVEDESICRELLRDVMAGYGSTDEAEDGVAALEKFQDALLRQEPYDLICLDIMMPELDGQETLMRIREIEMSAGVSVAEQVKIVMITALADSQNIIEAYGKGACVAYLTKPVTTRVLRGQLRDLGLFE